MTGFTVTDEIKRQMGKAVQYVMGGSLDLVNGDAALQYGQAAYAALEAAARTAQPEQTPVTRNALISAYTERLAGGSRQVIADNLREFASKLDRRQLTATREKLTEALTGVQIDGENGSAIIEESEAAQLADVLLASGVAQEAPAHARPAVAAGCPGRCYSLTESGAGHIDPECPVHAAKQSVPVVDIEKLTHRLADVFSADDRPPTWAQAARALIADGDLFQSEADVRADELERAAHFRNGITSTQGDAVDKFLRMRAAAHRGDRRPCRHEESLYGRCTACGMTWEQQAATRAGEQA
ncbi:hypothetical protein [Kribbella deserti]|uniref:Uncharacterized protein n=1 Tax=Kribbella deserti TaxID=1926257 RepID=A0ABV6QNC6_9ACTN